MNELDAIFRIAGAIAKGKVKTHVVDGKQIRYSIKEREAWARVAGYTAQIINAVAKNFDEHQLELMLTEAERIVHEARQLAEIKGAKLRTSATEASAGTSAASQGSS